MKKPEVSSQSPARTWDYRVGLLFLYVGVLPLVAYGSLYLWWRGMKFLVYLFGPIQ